ncbi:MAG TPA: ankyrin repeat domain-containing protein, partial [Rickettsia endosymbiont of Ceroptres masudai]|nr:ankyrin repeat domain-containing protein [Rickettsia endosymbiont of Ceroptres masudai]
NGSVEVVQLLLEKGANIDTANNNGDTALLAAAQNRSVEVVQLLLEKGANIDTANNNGDTTLLVAARNGHDEIVRKIIQNQRGVPDYSKSAEEKNIMYYYNHSDEMKRFLREWGAKEIIHKSNNLDNSILNNAQSTHNTAIQTIMNGRLEELRQKYGLNQDSDTSKHMCEIEQYIQLLQSSKEEREQSITFKGEYVVVTNNNLISKKIVIEKALDFALQLLYYLRTNASSASINILEAVCVVWKALEHTNLRSDFVKALTESALEYNTDWEKTEFQPICMTGIINKLITVSKPISISDISASGSHRHTNDKSVLVAKMVYQILQNKIDQNPQVKAIMTRIQDDTKYQDDDIQLRQEVYSCIYQCSDNIDKKIDMDLIFAHIAPIWDDTIRYYTQHKVDSDNIIKCLEACTVDSIPKTEILGQTSEEW